MSDIEKTNVNSEPFYIGPIMVLSDQDLTFLKHHILSSAVMGTAFAGLIATISNPEIPLLYRAALMGGILTGMQSLLVAASNVFISGVELWTRAGKPNLCWVCLACCWTGCKRSASWLWNAYVEGHTVHLGNGATVWIDGYSTIVLDAPESDFEGHES